VAAETNAARFPQNRVPNHQIFKSLVSSLRERGTFQQSTKSFINPTITHDINQNQARVLNLVENNPHIGSREISSQIGISKSSVLRILKKHDNTNITPTTWNFTKSCMVKILQIEWLFANGQRKTSGMMNIFLKELCLPTNVV
jgi:hypothetical protein